MITLTNPETIKSTVGGTGGISYDKMTIAQMQITVDQNVHLDLRATCSTDQLQPAINGIANIVFRHIPNGTIVGTAQIQITPLGVSGSIELNPDQVTAWQDIINRAVYDFEFGLIDLGLIDGTA